MGLVNHWSPDRHPEWTEQESAYALVLLINDDAVVRKAAEVQRSMDFNYLDKVTPTELFVPVASLGDTARTSREQAISLAQIVAGVFQEPIEITFGVAAVFGESVLSFVDPVEDVTKMRERVIAEVAKFPNVSLTVPTFPPHLPLAYSNQERISSELAAALAEFPVDGLGKTQVPELALIQLRREIRRYNFDIVEKFVFGAPQPSGNKQDGETKKPFWKRFGK